MQQKIEGLFKKKVEVRFTEENTSSDGGLLLVKQVLDPVVQELILTMQLLVVGAAMEDLERQTAV